MSNFDSEFRELLDNKSSGSKELLYKFNSLLYLNFKNISNFTSIINIAKNRWKEFQTIQNYLHKLEKYIHDNDKENLFSFIRTYLTTENKIYDTLFDNLYPHIKTYNSFITISNSRTIQEIFTRLKKRKKKIDLTISESRPQNEGKVLADNLLSLEINMNYITEAMIPEYVKKCDVAIVGADTILKNGNIVNKMGSRLLAIACQYYDKPFFVVADKSKKKSDNNFNQNQYDSSEIWDYYHPNLHIKNFYFEIVDKKLITKIITN